jgi:hypothetical protein
VALRFPAALVLVGAFVFAACGDEEVAAGRVRVGHLSPDAGTVNLYVNGNEVLPGIQYPGSTLYYDVREGSNEVSLQSNLTGETLLSATVNISGDVDRTVLAVNTAANLEALSLVDDNSLPASGRVRVRLVHAAPSAGTVDIYVTAPDVALEDAVPAATGVAFKTVSAYLDVAAGTYRVRVTAAGTTDVVIDRTIDLFAQYVTTISAIEAPEGGEPFDLFQFLDRTP